MKRSEVAELLTYAAAFDRRTIGDADVIAWQAALDGLDLDRCKAAVVTHYRRSTDYLQPAHLWALARAATSAEVDPALRQHCEQGTYCDDCKGVHRVAEPCAVLQPAPGNVREITSLARRKAVEGRPPKAPQSSSRSSSPLAQPHPMPPADLEVTRCLCGGAFIDNETGHEAHRTVFGHQPRQQAS